ncbi:MAG: spondin domain-containing protein [Chthonomonas sp.]|nr:spondin domain-containing protein [Chthonomonas sp.]
MKTKSWATATVFAVAAGSKATQFLVDWTNHGPQPLSRLFWTVGNTSFDTFKVGAAASSGIKAIAEGGNTTPMLALASATGSNLQAHGILTASDLLDGKLVELPMWGLDSGGRAKRAKKDPRQSTTDQPGFEYTGNHAPAMEKVAVWSGPAAWVDQRSD